MTARALLWPAALAVAALAAVGTSSGDMPGPVESAVAVWPVGEAVPIHVERGHARFTVPTTDRTQRTLVVVSSVARDEHERPFRLTANAAPRGERPAVAPASRPRARTAAATTPAPADRAPSPGKMPPAERTFHLLVRQADPASTRNYLPVRAVLRGTGARVAVYADAHDPVDPAAVEDVVATFDSRVAPLAARRWGAARDVDGDGRFTILMTGWLSRFGGADAHAVDGFVRGADFDSRLPAPFSNHCDMLYLSAELEPGPHLRTVLAHEYAHAVTFSHKTAPKHGTGDAGEEEGWLDEAIAHLVEDAHGFSRSNIDYRVDAFLACPERYRLVVQDYYAADLFRSHGNRGSTYLFLRWCVDHYGDALLDELIRSPRRGIANVEAGTGLSFADLYRAWTIELAMSAVEPRPTHAHNQRRGRSGHGRPHTDAVVPDAAAEAWSMPGTCSRYFVVEGSTRGGVRIEVDSPAGTELQVTAIRLTERPAQSSLAVKERAAPHGEAR